MELLTELLSYYENLKDHYRQEEFVELLREVQDTFGCISPETQRIISRQLNIGLPVIRTIIKQYPTLKEQEARHRITVCTGRNCHDNGCGKLLKKIEKETGATAGETTKDGRFCIHTQCCLKHCTSAPNLKVDEDLYTSVLPKEIPAILKKYH